MMVPGTGVWKKREKLSLSCPPSLPTPADEINIHIFFLSLCHPEDYALCTNNNCDLFAAASDETTEMGALLSNLRCSSGRFECEAVVSTNRRGNWVR